ncbi:MAG: hypothetical protein DRJ37_01850 [Thermoprotei archaeon]|nr:MAG: hypothetical protein DRJ37_01850 [Thermoprotei archaeon]
MAESFTDPIYIAWLKLVKPKVLPPIIPKGESVSETLEENTKKVMGAQRIFTTITFQNWTTIHYNVIVVL